jgi:hypothetical protein
MRDHEKLKSQKKQIVLLLFPCGGGGVGFFSRHQQAGRPPPPPKQLCVLCGVGLRCYIIVTPSGEGQGERSYIYCRDSRLYDLVQWPATANVFLFVLNPSRVENRVETDAVYRREQTRLCVMWDLAVWLFLAPLYHHFLPTYISIYMADIYTIPYVLGCGPCEIIPSQCSKLLFFLLLSIYRYFLIEFIYFFKIILLVIIQLQSICIESKQETLYIEHNLV